MSPIRHTHKLRALPSKKKEYVLCTGKEDRFEITRYFWSGVTCPSCKALRGKKK